jgi:hypothetical protein
MLLRLFRLGILVGLLAWAIQTIDLSQSLSGLFQTALTDSSQLFQR